MKNKGISLIVLVIIILVLAILATMIIVTLSNTNIISSARESVFKQEIADIKEQLYVIEKSNKLLGEDYNYVIPDDLQDKFAITVDRKLAYTGSSAEEAIWSEESGIEVASKEEIEFKTAFITLKNAVVAENAKSESERDYTDLVPDSLKDKAKVYDNGDLIYNGDFTEEEATWAREVGVTVIDDEGYSLMHDVEELGDIADTYVKANSLSTVPNVFSLQYIRKDTYNNAMWKMFAGEIDTAFVNYANKQGASSFANKKLKDTVTGKNIDFVHSMATINGYVENANSSDKAFREYGGWAGDLCSLVNDINTYNVDNAKTYEELIAYAKTLLASDTVSSSFSLADMLADIDAINIYNLLNDDSDLYETIYEYYYGSNYDKCQKRFTLFGEYLETLNDKNQEDGFNVVTRAFLGLAVNSEASYSVEASYYANIIYDDGISYDEKHAVRVAFVDYITAKIAEENM